MTPDVARAHRNEAVLDNPIWHSLTTRHSHFALGAEVGAGLARRYPADIGPLAALETPAREAYEDLAKMVPEGDQVFLLLEHDDHLVQGWRLLRMAAIVQMICHSIPNHSSPFADVEPLGPADYPEMLALALLTEPGPFRERTALLGNFIGIRVNGRLAAMAGQRLAPSGFTEVSAVCTHPDFRGRGYARKLVVEVMRMIQRDNCVPFLTSYEANKGAYEELGFSIRRTFRLAAIQPVTN
jgi:predicted GNAT family acetyltransferase